MTEAPYFWIRKIASHLLEYDTIPLFGTSPAFDWAHFSSALGARLGVHDLALHKKKQEWREAQDLTTGLGDDIVTFPVYVSPLSGSSFWMMPKESIVKLTSWIMSGHLKTRPISSDALLEGFYHYLLLQALDCAGAKEPLQHLSLLLHKPSSVPETDAFCIDIAIEFNEGTCWGRLAVDPALQKSWKHHFSEPQAEYIPTKIAQVTELTTGIKIGSVVLRPKEWKMIKPGDFVLLDTGNYHPQKETGAAYLTVGTTPLFQVKIKNNKIQLIDYAFIYEEGMDTNKATPHTSFEDSGEAELMPPASEEAVTLKELPIHVTVELSRLRITLEKLIHLVPGNLIELPIKPDQPVHLTVGGQLVGKAELVHLGEALGIRILEIG